MKDVQFTIERGQRVVSRAATLLEVLDARSGRDVILGMIARWSSGLPCLLKCQHQQASVSLKQVA